MTRLSSDQDQETMANLERIDALLRDRSQTDLRGIALKAIGAAGDEAFPPSPMRVAVVPVTAGAGIIPGFPEAVSAIADHIGLDSWVTPGADVTGMAAAYTQGSDIVVLADDFTFVAIHTPTGALVDNDWATGVGFATLLDLMAGGVRGSSCGVLGCGPVGTAAAHRLAALGADLTVCDPHAGRGRGLVRRLQDELGVKAVWFGEASRLLSRCRCIIDATPVAGIVPASAVGEDTVITAPGVPPGVTSEALKRLGKRYYHDDLPLGVATMLLGAVVKGMGGTDTERRGLAVT